MCSLLRAKGFLCIPPVGYILELVSRFDCEFVMTFQGHGSVRSKNCTQFEINSVFNEGPCLKKCTSRRMSCSGRTAHHPSWHMVRQASVCLSFKQIVARFSKCFPQMTGQIAFKFHFKFSNLLIYIIH